MRGGVARLHSSQFNKYDHEKRKLARAAGLDDARGALGRNETASEKTEADVTPLMPEWLDWLRYRWARRKNARHFTTLLNRATTQQKRNEITMEMANAEWRLGELRYLKRAAEITTSGRPSICASSTTR